MSAQSIRQGRVLDEALASGGDVLLICDLFGPTITDAQRYAATVDHPGIADYETAAQ